jgi:hypothetical protein
MMHDVGEIVMMNKKELLWGVHEWCIDIRYAIGELESEINRWLLNPPPGFHPDTYRSAAFWLLIGQQVAWTKFSSLAELLTHLEMCLAKVLEKIGADAFARLGDVGSFRHLYARHGELYRAVLRQIKGDTGNAGGSGSTALTPAPSPRELKRDPKFWVALDSLQKAWRPAPPQPAPTITDQRDTLPAPDLIAAVIARDDDDDDDDFGLPRF